MSDKSAEKTKGKPIVLIIVAANVLLGGAAAAFFLLRGSGGGGDAAAPAAAGHGGEGGDAKAPPPRQGATVGPIIEYKGIIVNLNEPEGTRYLKASIAVQLINDSSEKEAERLKSVIRDYFIRDLSDLNFRQTMGNKNKVAIKQRLLKRFNEAMGADVGVDLHLTEFIVQ